MAYYSISLLETHAFAAIINASYPLRIYSAVLRILTDVCGGYKKFLCTISSVSNAMPVVVSIPDEWFSHDFSGALFCPECNGPTVWEEISVQSPSGKDVLMFRCAKCHLITRRLLLQKRR